MGGMAQFRTWIRSVLSEYRNLLNFNPTPGVESLCVFDQENDEYTLVERGWDGKEKSSKGDCVSANRIRQNSDLRRLD